VAEKNQRTIVAVFSALKNKVKPKASAKKLQQRRQLLKKHLQRNLLLQKHLLKKLQSKNQLLKRVLQ